MADPDEPIIHTCHACGTLIDVSEQEPLSMVHCPTCGAGQRVRTQFDHFQLQEVLGAGGMGAVYRAFDANLSRFVALKLLRREYSVNPEFVAQFEREAAITASINHPHVVKVYSAGEDQGLVYIAMELVDKGSLDDLMSLQGRVAEPQVLEVGKQAAMGLNAALARGLIHRDVKPGNILFADAHSAKIVDFGLATLQEQASKGPGEVWGTPYYVAPEKLENPPVEDFRSDMYSLGATLFHALAGRPPFEAETASMVALKHLKSQAVSLQAFAPDVSSETAFVINKTLSKDPEKRYQSYHELIEHLDYARNEVLKKAGNASPKRARVVMEDAGEERAMSWITFVMIAIIVLGGIGAWVMRDKLFPPRKDTTAPAEDPVLVEMQAKYQAARDRLLKKEFTEAAKAFFEITNGPEVRRPVSDWADLHQGLSLLFAGKETDSRRPFSRLAARELYGKDQGERKLSQFLLDIGHAMEVGDTKPAAAARDLQKSNYEAIGLLLYALKDWHLGDLENGGALFRQFQSASPEEPMHWIGDYKELIGPYLDDFTLYRTCTDEVKGATSPEKRRSAIEKIKGLKEQLKVPGAGATKLDQMVKQLEKDLSGDRKEMEKREAEAQLTDEPKFAELRRVLPRLLATFRYAEAAAAIEGFKPDSAKYTADRKTVQDRLEVLAKFKAQLIRDVPGYTGPVKRTNGALLPAGKLSATDANLIVTTPFGAVPTPWSEISPESIITMAKSFIKADAPDAADRKWSLGLYALSLGQKALAKELLTEAAEAKEEYKALLEKISVSEGL